MNAEYYKKIIESFSDEELKITIKNHKVIGGIYINIDYLLLFSQLFPNLSILISKFISKLHFDCSITM